MHKNIVILTIILTCIISVLSGCFSPQETPLKTPGTPTNFVAMSMSRTSIDLSWTKGENASITHIERNTIPGWMRGDGIIIYNSTSVRYRDEGLSPNSMYYYQAWGWNQTNSTFSTHYASANETTLTNQPPSFSSPNPVNGSSKNPLNISWSIQINDPDGDPFSWSIQCSNGQGTAGTGMTNGTETLLLTSLSYLTTYKVWVNATDPTGSGLSTHQWYVFTTKSSLANKPPTFGACSPTNGTTDTQLSFSWTIPINDPEGDPIWWTIECNNGQDDGGGSASNGTKTLSLSGLSYSTTYKVWVNATDLTGSGQDTLRWYRFTTKVNTANTPPVFGTPSPANASTNNQLNLTWGIPITDPEGNTFSWTIDCSNGQDAGGSGATNSTKTLQLSGLSYLTTYKVWVNASDTTGSGQSTIRWYTFTTKANTGNSPPGFGAPSPTNGSTGNQLSLAWTIPIVDPQGNTFTWTIHCSNGQRSNGTGSVNGTKTLSLFDLSYSTTYKVWVNATDPSGSGEYTRQWYRFTTKATATNTPPVFEVPSPRNGSTGNLLNLTWSIPISDPEGNTFTWTIQCNNSQTMTAVNTTNGTKSLVLTNLSYSVTYKIWVNATDPMGSGLYTRQWYTFTTKAYLINRPPVLGKPIPANNSNGNPLQFEWTINITDPDGDPFTWTIECNNSENNNGFSEPNGTKLIVLEYLSYTTIYKLWVNATDIEDDTLSVTGWYAFTTKANQPPGPPTITGPPEGTIKVPTQYNFTVTDDTDELYYFIDWGDQTNSDWIGPYQSGDIVPVSHTWSTKGTYTIKAKAKDNSGAESDWASLSISMPTSLESFVHSFFDRLFERFPFAFPILRYFMGY